MESWFFYSFGGFAVLCALLMAIQRNPVTSALSLVGCLICVAALFALLEAHFMAAAQLLVYAGAIMVFFLFVIMLLDLGRASAGPPARSRIQKIAGVLLSCNLLVFLGWKIAGFQIPAAAAVGEGYGSTEAVAQILFTSYLLPFELVGILLLVAIVGAVVVARREG